MKIIITGASGIIGKVLMNCFLKKQDVIGIDRKEGESVIVLDILTSIEKIKPLVNEGDIIIHLAWDIRESGTTFNPILEENKKMAEIMFEIALERKAKRFVLASSVHASFGFFGYRYPNIVERHKDLHIQNKIKVSDGFYPLGAYGASKVYLEALGRAYSSRGLQVVAVRFGHVVSDDNHGEYPFWLSHKDCRQFIEKCVMTKNLPPFSTFFAVSDNECNPFDLSDAKLYLDYKPDDGSLCPMKNKL